jgi:hypothetical protein
MTVVQDCIQSDLSCTSVMASTKKIYFSETDRITCITSGLVYWRVEVAIHALSGTHMKTVSLCLLVSCVPLFGTWSQVSSTWFPKYRITLFLLNKLAALILPNLVLALLTEISCSCFPHLLQQLAAILHYTGLLQMIVGDLTTCHTQYTWDRSIFFYLIEQHSKFLLHTLQVLYMCTPCDSTNINTIIEFILNCL